MLLRFISKNFFLWEEINSIVFDQWFVHGLYFIFFCKGRQYLFLFSVSVSVFCFCLYKPPPEWVGTISISVFCFCFLFLFLFIQTAPWVGTISISDISKLLFLWLSHMSLFLRRESVVLFSWPNSKILRPRPTTHFICLHSVQPQLSGTVV